MIQDKEEEGLVKLKLTQNSLFSLKTKKNLSVASVQTKKHGQHESMEISELKG